MNLGRPWQRQGLVVACPLEELVRSNASALSTSAVLYIHSRIPPIHRLANRIELSMTPIDQDITLSYQKIN